MGLNSLFILRLKDLLFDIENDPLEMNDLSDDPDYQDIKAGLFIDLLDLQKEMKGMKLPYSMTGLRTVLCLKPDLSDVGAGGREQL
jgi:hypothetical protein